MPKFIGVIEKTEQYYVRINAPSKEAAGMWGTEMDWEDFMSDRDPDCEDIDMRRIIDPDETVKHRGKKIKVSMPCGRPEERWIRKAAHITVDEEGEETI